MKNNHTAFKLFAFLTITILLFGCTDAYKVPNQSVFEPLNAKQMKRALKAPFFDEFYSRYSRMINECVDSERSCYADITWRNLYKYFDVTRVEWEYDDYIGNLKDSREYFEYLNNCEQDWDKKYGQFNPKIDSIVINGIEALNSYFKQFVNVEFLKTERSVRYEKITWIIDPFSRVDEIIFSFKLVPVSDTIRNCRFYFLERRTYGHLSPKDSLHFSLCSPIFSSDIQTWKRCYKTYSGSDINPGTDDDLKKKEVVVTEVCLSNGKRYSISDLNVPNSVKHYYIGDVSKDEAEKGVFYDMLGYPYIGYNEYMNNSEDEWVSSRYPREKAFVEMLRKHKLN